MNNSRTKRLPKIIIGQTLVALLILVVSSYLIIYSMGYKINLQSRKIIKMGMIVLSVSSKPDSITINNLEKPAREDSSYQLEPGYYDIKISRQGYHDWNARCLVVEEYVNYYKYIDLFKNDAKLSELTDQKSIDYLNSPVSALVEDSPKGLLANDFEIWVEDKLVTRFSQKINSVAWYNDLHHMVYQRADEIRIIEDTGINDTLLVKLPTTNVAKFVFANRGKDLLVSQDGGYYQANIK